MTFTEADESFTKQSQALVNRKNKLTINDRYALFHSYYGLNYRRVRTRKDWFIVKTVRSSNNIDSCDIIKTIQEPSFKRSNAEILASLDEVKMHIEPDYGWDKSLCPMLQGPLNEQEIIHLLETTIFNHYNENATRTRLLCPYF